MTGEAAGKMPARASQTWKHHNTGTTRPCQVLFDVAGAT
jgi:hypothetical protein